MCSTSSNNLSRFNRYNSSIGVGNKSSITKTINTNRVDNTTSSSMSNLGSIYSRCINRYYSTISMGHKTMWVSYIGVSSIGDSRYYCTIGIGNQGSGGDSNTGSKNLDI